MKRFIAVLSGLLVLPAFAEVAPVYYDETIEFTDDMLDADTEEYSDVQDTKQPQQNVAKRTIVNRTTSASRTVPSGGATTSVRQNTSSRAIASSPRSTTGTSRTTVSRSTRAANTATTRAPTTTTRVRARSGNTQTSRATTARVGTSNRSVSVGNRGTTSGSATTLTDSGNSLYNANSARVGMTGRRSTARVSSTISQASAPVITEEDVSSTTSNLNALAELTDYCKAQYAACMDNYCNVLDDNEGRCSCSKNLKNYEKTELALAQATEDFQDTIQKIKYIGLTGNQIESLFTETEAELTMKSTSDSSRLKNSLDTIKKKIVDASSPTSSGLTATNGISLDLNGLLSADFSSGDGFDLNSLLNMTNNSSSTVSNQRGEQLYKTATSRCRSSVLNSCTNQGVDANVITNSYDLEIDKQCIAYERSLNDANKEMKNNVRNATTILQQARLMLAQNRNSYDFRGCIAAIDSCMQDEYVCGSDYELCLDPTGKYLANGEVVKGGTPGVSGGQAVNEKLITSSDDLLHLSDNDTGDWYSEGMYNLYATWNYGNCKFTGTCRNAWSVSPYEDLGQYIDENMANWKSNYKKTNIQSDSIAMSLLQKIGYIDKDDKVHGMCASVMKQCQDYTFNTKKNTKTYIPDNEVLRQYLNTALPKIKAQQDAILSDYAEGCRSDVQSCLSTNGYDESNTSSTASKSAVNACSSEITTCMSVGGYQISDGVKLTLRAMTDWVSSMMINCPVDTYLYDDGKGVTGNPEQANSENAVQCKSCGYPEVVDINGQPITAAYANHSGIVDNGNGTYRTANRATSAGGQVTVCDCPEGFDNYYKTVNGIVTLKCQIGVDGSTDSSEYSAGND